jgi:hypothetical protein
MALTWVEDSSSRSATIFRLGRKDASTRTRVFNVFGTTNEDVLHASANQAISTQYPYWQYPGQPTVKLRAESYAVEYQGDDSWKVTINYEKIGADDSTQTAPLKRARSFDTSGGTQHITESVTGADKGAYAAGGATPTSMGGAIGVDDNGVNGVDIVIPALQWQESYDVPSNYVTSAYIRNLAIVTGSVNQATFRGFAPGEVLFIGASGNHEWDDQRGNGPWSLSFKFVASPNAGAGKTLPAMSIDGITGIEKGGHDYLWIQFAKIEDSAKAQMARRPFAVYVDKVYKDGDFSLLGIGVA